MTYKELWQTLVPTYDEHEAKSIARMVYEHCFGLSLTDVCMGKDKQLSEKSYTEIKKIAFRLLQNEPVQYVLGCETFCGRTFAVAPGVLIPRPETEGLIDLLRQRCHPAVTQPRILDIGTGSGCIAITAALDIEGAYVEAWDVAPTPLRMAADNARSLGARVNVVCQDALCPPDDVATWDFILSNPPYVCERERAAMSPNVLDHEPAEALFVPDADPLKFYRSIARYAVRALRRGGWMMFEINPAYADDMALMLQQMGFADVATVDDVFGRQRFAVARAADDIAPVASAANHALNSDARQQPKR